MELLKDRNYYRMCGDAQLMEQARSEPTAELALVLAERLADVSAALEVEESALHAAREEHEREVSSLDDQLYLAQGKLLIERERVLELSKQIERLKEKAND